MLPLQGSAFGLPPGLCGSLCRVGLWVLGLCSGLLKDWKPLDRVPESEGPVVTTSAQVLASLVTEGDTGQGQGTAAPCSPAQPRGWAWPRGVGCGPGEAGAWLPTPQGPPVTVALRGSLQAALWLAHPDMAGTAWAVALVTRVQGPEPSRVPLNLRVACFTSPGPQSTSAGHGSHVTLRPLPGLRYS